MLHSILQSDLLRTFLDLDCQARFDYKNAINIEILGVYVKGLGGNCLESVYLNLSLSVNWERGNIGKWWREAVGQRPNTVCKQHSCEHSAHNCHKNKISYPS